MGGNNVNVVFGANIEGLIAGVEGVKEQLEGLASFTEGLTSTFTGVGEAIAAAFAVEKIESFIEHISDLGSKIESTAAQLGFSTEKVLALQYAAGIADVSLDQATRTIDHFYMATQTAQTGTSRQAAAFRALGIDIKDLTAKGTDLNQIFDITVGSLGKYADGANKSAIVMDLFGNRSAQTVRLVNILSEGMGELVEKTQALDPPTKQYLDTMREVHVRMTDLSTVTTNWKMALAQLALMAVGVAEGFVEFLSIVKSVFDGFGIILVGALNNLRDFGVGTKNILEEIANPGAGYFDRIKTAAMNAMHSMHEDTHNAGVAVDDLIKKEKDLIDVLEHPKMLDAGNKSSGEGAPGIVTGDALKSGMKAWEDALNEMLLKQQLFGAQALDAELKFWQDKLLIVKKGTADYMAIEHKIYDVEKQLNAQRIRDEDKAEKEQERVWNRFFNSFNSGIMGMLKGTSTWKDAVRNAFFNVVENGLKMMEKLVAHWIATEHAKTAATVAGNAARTTSDISAAKASSGGFGGTAIAQIQGDAAKAYGGVYGFLAPSIGPLAAIPAAAAYVAVIGMEALVPSFDVGTWNVPVDTLAHLHAGERVMTASENEAYSKGGGGGVELHIHGGINDAKSIRALLLREGPTLARSMKKQGMNTHNRVPK